MTHQLGRLPRAFNPLIPKMEDVTKGKSLIPLPADVNYTNGISQFGMMMNDTLGDCTAAAASHCVQIWSLYAGNMITPTDAEVEALYEATSGYVPGNPATDTGAVEQTVLEYWLSNPLDGNELTAFIELNPHNIEDIKRSVFECGVCYIGFAVPAYLMNTLTAPGSLWDVEPTADNSIVGGHAVAMVGYDATSFTLISWGGVYKMSFAFWAAFVDEAYALVDAAFVSNTGLSPGGLTVPELTALMDAVKFNPDNQHHKKKKKRKHR